MENAEAACRLVSERLTAHCASGNYQPNSTAPRHSSPLKCRRRWWLSGYSGDPRFKRTCSAFARSRNTHGSAGRPLSRYTELQLPAVPVTAMIGVDALPTFNRFMATCSRLEYAIGMNRNIVDASPLSQPAQCGLESA
jgi:hypothetical protein